MSRVHIAILRLDGNVLALDGAADRIAQLDEPRLFLALRDLDFRDEDTVVSARLDVDETLHVFDRSLVDLGVPEGDAHISSLWLTISKDNSIVKVGPHVLWLDVCEKNIGINRKNDS